MKNALLKLGSLFALLLALSACSEIQTRVGAITKRVDLTEIGRSFPRVDGSTTSLPLLRLIGCKSMGIRCSWQEGPATFGTDKTKNRYVYPDNWNSLSDAQKSTFDRINVNTTHSAFMNLIEGRADVILIANPPSAAELQAMKEKGVELDIRPIALDALVFVLNVQNPVDTLTIDQARDILSGKIKDWSEVKGPAAAIEPYQREPNSGSQELLLALVMKGTPMVDAPEMVVPTMMGEINMVGGKPHAFGYSVYYYVTSLVLDPRVKMIAVNGVKPTAQTIANRTYPLAAEFYVAVRKNMPADSTAIMLRDWLLTDEGQATVAESGYVPIGGAK